MARPHFVKSARKAQPQHGIEVGDSYWWWAFRVGGRGSIKKVSKTKPTRSQLTQSNFLSQLYDIEDGIPHRFSDDMDPDDARGELETLAGEIEELGSEARESFDAMPESLQQGPTGEMLGERADAMESWADEVRGLDPEDYADSDELADAISECQPDVE